MTTQTAVAPVSLLALKDHPDFSGVLVHPTGRVAVLNKGRGFALLLTAEEMRDLARRCAATAAVLAERERAAAAEAGDDLRRLTAGSVGTADG